MSRFSPEAGEPTLAAPNSQLCTAAQFAEPLYARWCEILREPPTRHRKQWEYIYILQVLETRGLLRPGVRALGFGVGNDPLTAILASRGVEVVATDLPADDRAASGWIATGQHAPALEQLNGRAICDPATFARNVRFEPADMRDFAGRFEGFDFVWSCCALEHLGTLAAGAAFVLRALDTIKPGGLAVHTTEYNIRNGWRTRRRGATVLYRRRDLERLFARAATSGFVTYADWGTGDQAIDAHVDLPPYRFDPHIRLLFRGYPITSFGLVLENEGPIRTETSAPSR